VSFQLSQAERSGARAQFTLTARPQREDLDSESWRSVEDVLVQRGERAEEDEGGGLGGGGKEV